MPDAKALTRNFSQAACALLEAMISDFETTNPEDCAAVAEVVRLGKGRLSISLASSGGKFDITLDCVNAAGDRVRLSHIEAEVPRAN